MSKHEDPRNMRDALGHEAMAWMWAIHQPRCERGQDLLIAISDGDDQMVRHLMDEPETHDMLGDDAMFSAFMIACAMHGGRGCWEQIKPHGYNLDTQFQEPVFDGDGGFIGMYSKETRAGDWIGSWCSMERMMDLADDMDWAIFDMEGDRRPAIGCNWRLSGTHADNGWLELWKQQYIQTMEKNRRAEGSDDIGWFGVSRVVNIPRALFVMDEWVRQSGKKQETEAAARGVARLDDMILTWAREAYWPSSDPELWNRLWERPPHINTSQIDPEKAVLTLMRVGGVLAKSAGANQQDLVDQVENLGWMIDQSWHVSAAALIAMGAPLNKDGVDIGDKIIRRALLSKGIDVDPVLWSRWLGRAKSEGSQAWERVPEFVREMSVSKIRQRVNKDSTFLEMIEMALDTQARAPAKPAARF